MKIELTHDIIAEKIWERLPEKDRFIMQIRANVERRFQLHRIGSGSLLGEREINAWQAYFPLLDLEDDRQDFIRKSIARQEALAREKEAQRLKDLEQARARAAEIQKRRRTERWAFLTIILLITAAAISMGYLLEQLNQRNQALNDSNTQLTEARTQLYNTGVRLLTITKDKYTLEYQRLLNEGNRAEASLNFELAEEKYKAALDSLAFYDNRVAVLYQSLVHNAPVTPPADTAYLIDANGATAERLIEDLTNRKEEANACLARIAAGDLLLVQKEFFDAKTTFETALEICDPNRKAVARQKLQRTITLGTRYYEERGDKFAALVNTPVGRETARKSYQLALQLGGINPQIQEKLDKLK